MTKTTIRFTDENWQRHLNSVVNGDDKPITIWTTRDEPKGEVGDIFIIRDIEFMLDSVHEFTNDDYCNEYEILWKSCYEREGFDNPEEFQNEVARIYPDKMVSGDLYLHCFIEVLKS